MTIYWDEAVKRYRNEKGKFISEPEVRELLLRSMEAQRNPLETLSQRLINKEISVALFEKEFKKLIKNSYIISYTSGRGGRNMMTPSDWGNVGQMLRGQYEYLRGFIQDIQNGRYQSPKAIQARSQLYINSSTQAYEKGKATSFGLPDLPAYPGQGSECQSNCKCFWRIVQLGNGDYDCYWELTSGESCPTCVQRASAWSPVQVRGGQIRSAEILINFMANKFIVSDNQVRNVASFDDRTEYYFLGFPYKGTIKSETLPHGSDLHGTSFAPETELGMLERAIPVYWEHGMGELGTELLGRAYIDEETEEGRLLKVVVDRRNKYHNFLQSLNELGILRGSGHSLPYPFYDVDETTGKLRKFHVGEYTMTVTPSNDHAKPVDPDTLQKLRNIFLENNIDFERSFMAQKQKTADEIALEEKARAAGSNMKEEEESTSEDEANQDEMPKNKKQRTGIAEEIRGMFEVSEQEQANAVSADTLALLNENRAMREELAELRSLLEEVIDAQRELARGVQLLPTRVAAERRSFSTSEEDVYQEVTPRRNSGKTGGYAPRGSGFTHLGGGD